MTSRIAKIIELFTTGLYNAETNRRFVRWFRSDVDRQAKEEALSPLWTNAAFGSSDDARRSLGRFLSEQQQSGSKRTSRTWWRYAAVLLVPILSVAFTYTYISKYGAEELTLVEYYADKGEHATITLPDQSTVLLNPGSVLLVPRNLTKAASRNVHLMGNASFTVTKDPKHPFIVKARNLNIEVLGTEFNVSAYYEDNIQSATLKSGSVKIFADGQEQSPQIMTPNQQFRYYSDTKRSECIDVDVENVYAWNRGDLVFVSLPLTEITTILERRFNVKIYIMTQAYEREKISVRFSHNETIEEVFAILEMVIPSLKYEIQGKTIYIR